MNKFQHIDPTLVKLLPLSRRGRGALLFVGAALILLLTAQTFAWRSALYPTYWYPGYTDGAGRFLHDFSYAGYHNSEIPVPVVTGLPTLNVVTGYGADPTGVTNATAAIQNAINDAETSGGAIVYIPAGLYKCDGTLLAKGDNTIIRGAGPALSKLYFTQCSAGMAYNAHLTFKGNVQWGSDILLAADGQGLRNYVLVNSAAGLSPGQEIAIGWVITDAFIADHGMTGTWVSFNGQWKPFFRRKIKWLDTSVTPNKVYVDVPLRYPALVRDSASIRPLTLSPSVHGYLKECGLEDLAVTNASTASCAATYDQVQAITFQDTEDCWVRNVQSFASPNPGASGFHLQSGGIDIESSNRVTVTNCQMQKAQNKGSGGNGYLFQVTRSNEVLFTDCTALEGRHNFIQNWDFGTTGCVWHRCHTANGDYLSEYHHSLSMACLVDCCIIDDGWQGGNRQDWSSGAGHTVTQSCYWNNTGTGWIGSWNYGWGYVIGTAPGMIVQTGTWLLGESLGTEPWDYTEGLGQGATLDPPCLFDDQLARRMANSIRRSSWEIYQ